MMQFNSYQGSDPYILACFHRSDQKKVFSLLDLLNENGYRIKYLDETQINQTNIF